MKRSQVLLAALGGVLLIALFFFSLYQPERERLAEVEAAIAAEADTQTQLNAEIARLRLVRETAPEVEAQLAAAEAIVPRDPALPAALRQLQLAADEAGVVLESVATARPVLVDGSGDGLSSIVVTVQLQGEYFQVVDFLRRVEEPSISPRGLVWSNASVGLDSYPDLAVSLSGNVFAVLEDLIPPVVDPDPVEGEAGEDEEGRPAEPDASDDADADDEVDVEDAP